MEEVAAGLLRRYWETIDRLSLRVFTYKLNLPTKTKKRVSNLLFGVVMNLRLIDWIIEKINIEVTNKDLLRILIYRLAIERNSEVAQRIRRVNSISIDDLMSKCEEALKELTGLPRLRRLALVFSYPDFLVRRLSKYMDLDELEKMLKTMNHRLPYTWVCVNTSKHTRKEVLDILRREGFRVVPDEDFYDLIRIEELPRKIENSFAYRGRMILIMEKASVAATHALEPKPGDIILDMAAAPGIKLIATSFKMSEGKIYAVDISAERMRRLKGMVRRYLSDMDIELKMIVCDARKLKPEDFGDVNKIILDAECSSTGMIPKSPDVKLRISPKRIMGLSKLQRELLSKAVEIAKYSGAELIVYSVCSVFPEEGEFVIRHIINNNEDVEVVPVNFGGQSYIPNLGVRFFPHIHKTIGFYISKLRIC